MPKAPFSHSADGSELMAGLLIRTRLTVDQIFRARLFLLTLPNHSLLLGDLSLTDTPETQNFSDCLGTPSTRQSTTSKSARANFPRLSIHHPLHKTLHPAPTSHPRHLLRITHFPSPPRRHVHVHRLFRCRGPTHYCVTETRKCLP